MLSYTKWQYGVEADYRQLSYLSSASSFYVLQANPSYNTVFISRKAIPFIAFVNRKITISHFEPYAGISVGYLLATQCDDPYALADVYYNHVVGNGVTGGVQAGATYFITNHLGINAEIKGDFMWLTLGAATYKLFDFPAMVGIRYKL